MENLIELKNVYFYLTKDFYALFDINLEIAKGEKVVLLGDNDSGKTSLLRLILGRDKPTKGEILLAGVEPSKMDFKNKFNALFITSSGVFFENKTCYENLEKICKIKGIKPDFIKINSFLQQFGLYSYKDTKAKNLNKFNRVMLQFARASLREDLDLVVVDDIFEDLAFAEREHVIKHLKNFTTGKNLTSIVATNNPEIAKSLGKRIVKLKLGSIEGEA